MRRRWAIGVALSLGAAALTTGTGYAVVASGDEHHALGPGFVTVDVGIDHSRFDIGTLRVTKGTTVEFVVHNGDPIDHELIVGTPEVHRAHETGEERSHPPRPGEVSVAPGQVAATFYELTEVGSIVYACHLPGHVAYGMQGTIEVVDP
ncbi:MAG: plastocyanin/azurin family copper-binding protein [Acidimicrobiales bacterium]